MKRSRVFAAVIVVGALALVTAAPAQAHQGEAASTSNSDGDAGALRSPSGVKTLSGSLPKTLRSSADLRPIQSLLTPAGAPALPSVGQSLKIAPQGKLADELHTTCYPPGTAGYEPDCVDDTYVGRHWGTEPYFNTHHRYIWVVDELPAGSRESAWLQFVVGQFNRAANDPNRPAGNERPTFIYRTRAQAGAGWYNCRQRLAQVVEVCPFVKSDPFYDRLYPRSYSRNFSNAAGHFVKGYLSIKLGLDPGETDARTEGVIAHEFGHMIGFPHDTDCNSVMTYCSTFGAQYLWYGPNQVAAYQRLYVAHHRN